VPSNGVAAEREKFTKGDHYLCVYF